MAPALSELTVLVRGGGEMASGIAHRLHRCHMRLAITEIAAPTAVRRGVAFAEAVYETSKTVDGVEALRVASEQEAHAAWQSNKIPLFIDPDAAVRAVLKPVVIVDATMAKKSGLSKLTDARLVIGVGPGFTAGVDVHAVVESNRGYYLGRVIWQGTAEPDTGLPAAVDGHTETRVLRVPKTGVFNAFRDIGDAVRRGEIVAEVDGESIPAQLSGQLRGILRSGIHVRRGIKAGDIDPRGERGYCYSISDKSRAIAGGVLEAVLHSVRDLRI